MAEKLDVGDAVLTFTGDMTQLDLAFAKVNATVPTALDPAKESATDLSNTLSGLGTYFGQAGEAGVEAGAQMEQGLHRGAAAAREAKAEMALLGEETGVRIPRHLRAFVAELPGVGEALTAAFSATAVLMLIQILVEGVEKLSKWIENTFIFTQAMKDANAAIIAQNSVLLALQLQIKETEKAMSEFGKTPLELAAMNVAALTKTLDEQKKQFYDNEQAQAAYRMGLDDITKEMAEKAGAANLTLAASIKLTNDLLEQAQVAQAEVVIETQLKNAKQVISIEESVAEGKKKIWQALAIYQASFLKDSTAANYLIEKDATEKEYLLKLDALKRERVAQEQAEAQFRSVSDNKNGDRMAAEVKASNAKIEALNAEHYVTELKRLTDFQNQFKEIEKGIFALPQRNISPLGPFITDMQLMEEAAARLGVTLSGSLHAAFTTSKDDLAAMKKSYDAGQIGLKDYQKAEVASIAANIEWKKSIGQSTDELEKQQAALQKEIDGIKKTQGFWDAFSADFKKKAKEADTVGQQMGQVMANMAKEADTAFSTAIIGALTTGQSIGAALEQATKAILTQLAEQALAKSLYYTAEGIAAATMGNPQAAGFFAAAGEFALVAGASAAGAMMMGGGSNGGAPNANSGTSFSNPGGAQQSSAAGGGSSVTGIQKFATGGLITGPTLAMIGDDKSGGRATEAVLPLDDEDAMSKMRDSLGTGGGGTPIHVHVKGMISPDNLGKVVRQINRKVGNRQLSLQASNSFRVTRRSQ